MSEMLHREGTREIAIVASDVLTLYSKDRVKVYSRTTKPEGLEVPWSLLVDNPPDTEYTSSAFSVATDVRIETESADAYYAIGTGPVVSERRGIRGQGAPGVLNATGALTAAMIGAGIVTSTTAAAVAGTVPTGTVLDAAFEMEIGESIDWSVIVTGPNAFTVTAATGHTLVGAGAVATGTSGLFRTRKTAANTFVTYRVG